MARTLTSTPRQDGFRMPGEFEPHIGCWMLWPERSSNWRSGAKPAQQAFAAVATAIATGEPVTVGAPARSSSTRRAMLPDAIRVVEMSSDDSWMRDVGPTFVVGRRGRGARRRLDVQRLGRTGRRAVFSVGPGRPGRAQKCSELEGRDRYARRSCWKVAPSRRRRGHAARDRGVPAEPESQSAAGHGSARDACCASIWASPVIWLGKGVVDDETDGHVDNLCCFARPGEVVPHLDGRQARSAVRVSKDAYERLWTPAMRRGAPSRSTRCSSPIRCTARTRRLATSTPSRARSRGDRESGWRAPTSTSTSRTPRS